MKYLGETTFTKIEKPICTTCPQKNNDKCDLLLNFINKGVDFNKVPFDCPLPDFHFDGYMESIKK